MVFFCINFCIWCEGGMYIQLSQYHFLKSLFFPHLTDLALLSKLIGHRCMDLFLDSQSHSIGLYVYSYTRTQILTSWSGGTLKQWEVHIKSTQRFNTHTHTHTQFLPLRDSQSKSGCQTSWSHTKYFCECRDHVF